MGKDALKAHAVLVRCAEKFGGVVYPPVYFPHADYNEGKPELCAADRGWKVIALRSLFQQLKKTGFRVIIGVSGHNILTQIELINEALKPVVADGTAAGIGLWEVTLSQCEDSGTDHAAKWETSNMLAVYPDLVDLSALGAGALALDVKPPDGIGGLDPRKHASAEVGRRNIELAADAIGKKARELLASLPPQHRNFGLKKLSPEYWWLI